MSSKTKRLKIVQASLQFDVSDEQFVNDFRKILTLKPHILFGTESGDRDRKQAIEMLCENAGYRVFLPAATDAWIAVRSKLIGHGWSAGYRELWGTGQQMGDPHHYDAKGLTLVQFDHPALGHVVLSEVHYMRTAVTPDKAKHIAVNKKLAVAMSNALHTTASGTNAVGFVGLDSNMIDEHSDVFFGLPLTTCWDELKRYPDTGHGNIDAVASCDWHKRVKCVSAEVLDDKEFFLHQDHYIVVAYYDVIKLDQTKGA